MKIEINNGRVIDPRNGIDRKTSLFIAAGKVAAIGSAPPSWHANR
jgi:dihydroorotase